MLKLTLIIKKIRLTTILQIFFFSFFTVSCNNLNFEISEINGQNIKILKSNEQNQDLENLIKPYRNKIKNLSKVIGYSETSMSINDGKLESSLGNFLADILRDEVNPIFKELHGQSIDFCILNKGGIRASINKGPITQHDLFKVMPFDNKSVIVKITGRDVMNLINFINKENKSHPTSGIKINFDENKIIKILIQNSDFDPKKNYFVLTSDFLQNGGDNMFFLTNPIDKYEIDLNIRDAFIKNILKKDTISGKKDKRLNRI